LENRAPDMQQL